MKLQPVAFDSADQQQPTASVPISTMINIGILWIWISNSNILYWIVLWNIALLTSLLVLLLPLPRRICNCRRLSVCLSVCLLATLHKNFQTDLHEIFGEGWQWAYEQMIKFWWRSGSGIWIWIQIQIWIVLLRFQNVSCRSVSVGFAEKTSVFGSV